ncbi:uncharacterized protein F5891DRAFT_1000627 [Suillus fuscotomentosus]|uniref:Uncharacterized protein n=1 Tax=Suillus fuscotomentosus TaxID=1912939 RepID=A0AAD4HTZ0_9AGAM|nr:uncharacterized protein F5891DRAFT_1000627 [Suillus fuscotomentosus]KAG1907229.1 hypothetical protein F5891DRAFT_1000627 [Suillus fuscotomentosus]
MTSYSAIKTWGTQDCAPFNDALNGLHFLSIIAAEVLLIFRVYAFSGKKKAYLISILLFGSAILVASVVISAAPINWRIPGGESQGSLLSLSIHPLSGSPCVMEGAHSSALPYALLMFFEIVLMSTTAFLRYRHYLGSHSALMKSVYRDGLLYMLCITSIEAILSYSETLNTPQIVAHSVLASRILFNLQESMAQPLIPTYRSATSIEFNARSGGNQTASQADEA